MYILHTSPDSAPMVVQMVLLDLSLPYELREVDRLSGGLDSAEFRALNPLGKIPALETPDGVMFETAAILLYLADRHGGLAPSPASPERAAFLSWLFFTSTNLHPLLLTFFYPDRTAGAEATPALLAHSHAKMAELLGLIETMLARDAPVWFSTEPSILGYYLGMLMHWLGGIAADEPGHFPSRDFPQIHARLAALETRPCVQTVAKAEALGALPFTAPYL
jgi:glutathione S-transferase